MTAAGTLPPGATAYVVGGAVRDRLLGLPALDRDWVVVGSTAQAMLAAGFRPVGRDFPVFLHPATSEEFALARTERKTAAGYHGFSFHAAPEVTLEEDLARRDLTINAMAEDAAGRIIDPYGGRADLTAQVLRHVSPAFAEDPVRILRLARFAARFDRFTVAPETLALMRGMVLAGEVDALVSERVWQELARGLMQAHPERMLQVLHDATALARLLPGLSCSARVAERLRAAAQANAALPVRFAVLCVGMAPAQSPGLARHLRVPQECLALVELLAREEPAVAASEVASPSELLALLERADAWRRPERFDALLQAAALRAALPPRWRAQHALALARQVDSGAITAAALAAGARGPAVGQALHAARVAALTAGLPPL